MNPITPGGYNTIDKSLSLWGGFSGDTLIQEKIHSLLSIDSSDTTILSQYLKELYDMVDEYFFTKDIHILSGYKHTLEQLFQKYTQNKNLGKQYDDILLDEEFSILFVDSHIEYRHKLSLLAIQNQNVGELHNILSNIQKLEAKTKQYELGFSYHVQSKIYEIRLLCEIHLHLLTDQNLEKYLTYLIEFDTNIAGHNIGKTRLLFDISRYLKQNQTPETTRELFQKYALKHNIETTKDNPTILFYTYLDKIKDTQDESLLYDYIIHCFSLLETIEKNEHFSNSYLTNCLKAILYEKKDLIRPFWIYMYNNQKTNITNKPISLQEPDKITDGTIVVSEHKNLTATIKDTYINTFKDQHNNILQFNIPELKEFDEVIKKDLCNIWENFSELMPQSNYAFGMNFIRILVKNDPTYISSLHGLIQNYITHRKETNNEHAVYTMTEKFTKIYDQIINYTSGNIGIDEAINDLYHQFSGRISTKQLKEYKTILVSLQEYHYKKYNQKGLIFQKPSQNIVDHGLDPVITNTIELVNLFEYYQCLCHVFKSDKDPSKKSLELMNLRQREGYISSELYISLADFIQHKKINIGHSNALPMEDISKKPLSTTIYKKFIEDAENILSITQQYELMEASSKLIVKQYKVDVLKNLYKYLDFSSTITIIRHGPTESDLVCIPELEVKTKDTEGLITIQKDCCLKLFNLLSQRDSEQYNLDTLLEGVDHTIEPLSPDDYIFEAIQVKFDQKQATSSEELMTSVFEKKYNITGTNIEEFFQTFISKTGLNGICPDSIHTAGSVRSIQSAQLLKKIFHSSTPIYLSSILNNPEDKHNPLRILSAEIADGGQKSKLGDYAMYTYMNTPYDIHVVVGTHTIPGKQLIDVINEFFTKQNDKEFVNFSSIDIHIGTIYPFKFKGGQVLPMSKNPNKKFERDIEFIEENEEQTSLFSLTNEKRFYTTLAPNLLASIRQFKDGYLQKYLDYYPNFLASEGVKLYEQEDYFRDFLCSIRDDDNQLYIEFLAHINQDLEQYNISSYLQTFDQNINNLINS